MYINIIKSNYLIIKTVLFSIQKLALKTLCKFTDCEILIAMIF